MLAALLAAAAVAGAPPADAPAAAAAPAQVAPAVVTPAAAPAKRKPALICESDAITGTKLKKPVCYSRDEREAMAAEAQRRYDRMTAHTVVLDPSAFAKP